jgi:hypothetical protein
VYQCIFEESAKDAKWAESLEIASKTAESCMEGAEDMLKLKVNECVKPVLGIVDTKCSTETLLNACSASPECISEAEKLEECLEESTTDTKRAESLENALGTAESCLKDAENILDYTECVKPILEIADEKCPIDAALNECGVAHSVLENFVLDLAEELKAGECSVCCFIWFERVWVSLLCLRPFCSIVSIAASLTPIPPVHTYLFDPLLYFVLIQKPSRKTRRIWLLLLHLTAMVRKCVPQSLDFVA